MSAAVLPAPAAVHGRAPAAPPAARRSARALDALAVLLTAGLAAGLALLPLRGDPRHYFVDDTQSGAVGIWYRLGESLSRGELPPLLDLTTWQAGNIAVEGQWGLWNPLVLAIGLFVHASTDLVVAATVVKVVTLAVAAAGTHLLIRSYGASAPWAVAGGVSVTLAGFTALVDATSWVTGLLTWALLPWFWVALRRLVHDGRNPLPAAVAGYLIVSVGYVHGTLALIAVLAVMGTGLLRRRAWGPLARMVALGLVCGLVTLTVLLPGVLSVDVTSRNEEVRNSGFMAADLSDLLTAAVAASHPEVQGFWGWRSATPLTYVAWFLPLLALVDRARARPVLRDLGDQLGVLVVLVLFVIGPSDIGALRFPVRMVPYVASAAVVATVVLLARARAERPSASRLAAALGLLGLSGYAAWSADPEGAGAIGPPLALAAVGTAAVWALLRWAPAAGGRERRGAVPAVAAVLLVVAAATAVAQQREGVTSPFDDWRAPASPAAYRGLVPEAVGDVMVVGGLVRTLDRDVLDPTTLRRGDLDRLWTEASVANLWLVGDTPVTGTYSPVGHRAFSEELCLDWRGESCPELLPRLFEQDRRTGLTPLDEMGVSTLVVFRWAITDSGSSPVPPPGWSEVASEEFTVTWVRDEPVPPAGGVVWASEGTAVREVSASARELVLGVDAVPPGGGQLVLSRLAWPGYEVDGASLADPVDDYLLTVDVPADAAGDEVVVRFDPPGWDLERAAWAVAVTSALLWSAVALVLGARRRRARAGADR